MRALNLKGEDAKADSSQRQIEEFAQDKAHEFSDEAWTTASIAEREIKFALVSGTMYLYTRKDDVIYRVALTAI